MPSAEQTSFFWEILAGLTLLVFSTFASIVGAMFSRANRAETQIVKNEINNVKDGQVELRESQRELKSSITRVHERIDESNKEVSRVDGKVNKLEGRADTMEKLFNGKARVGV